MAAPGSGLLNHLLHTADVYNQERTRQPLGDHQRIFRRVQTGVKVWFQTLSDQEILDFQVRGFTTTHRAYFKTNPGLNESQMLRYVDSAGVVRVLEIVSHADKGAGAGGPYRLVVRELSSDVDPAQFT